MRKAIILIFLSIALHMMSIKAQNYEISLKVNHLKDSMIYLACHYGNSHVISDSVNLDKHGKLIFKGDKKLPGGIYFIFLPNGKYFDFLIDDNQHFSIECDTSNFLRTVKFKNSAQNTQFYTYQKYLAQEFRVIQMLKEKQKSYIAQLDSLMLMEDKIQQRRNKIYLVKEDIIAKNPDSLLSVLIKAELPIIPPPAPSDSSGNVIDSTFAYKYVKKHYFDNIDFSDKRLIRSSLLQNKVLAYLSTMVVPVIDSVTKEVDMIVSKSAANPNVYEFVLNTLFTYYNRSNLITDENVFVYIAEKYYLSGKAPWSEPTFLQKLKTNIERRKLSLIGVVAPDFSMKNDKGKTVNLRDIQNKHVVLYFYDIDCEICKKVSPQLMNFYRIIKDRGVDIIGIYVGEDKKKWHKYLENNNLQWINVWDAKNSSGFREKYSISSTPQLFLLDEDQKIVLKRITVEQLMQYFNTI